MSRARLNPGSRRGRYWLAFPPAAVAPTPPRPTFVRTPVRAASLLRQRVRTWGPPFSPAPPITLWTPPTLGSAHAARAKTRSGQFWACPGSTSPAPVPAAVVPSMLRPTVRYGLSARRGLIVTPFANSVSPYVPPPPPGGSKGGDDGRFGKWVTYRGRR